MFADAARPQPTWHGLGVRKGEEGMNGDDGDEPKIVFVSHPLISNYLLISFPYTRCYPESCREHNKMKDRSTDDEALHLRPSA